MPTMDKRTFLKLLAVQHVMEPMLKPLLCLYTQKLPDKVKNMSHSN